MLEKINAPGFETLSRPDLCVVNCLHELLKRVPAPVFYEIGVGVGATTLAIARLMRNSGEIVLFSRQNDVEELAADLAREGFTNVNANWGSPSQIYSGYHFELARGFVDKQLPLFDLAYIDGGHVFHLDAPACCILKELCKPGGFMIFDDWFWNMTQSPTFNPQKRPRTREEYDERQIEMCHVQLVCKAFMDTDPRFEFIRLESGSAIYQRRALS